MRTIMQSMLTNQNILIQMIQNTLSKSSMAPLRSALWNDNGVSRHKLELAQLMNDNEMDVMLLAETHLTNIYNFQIRGYMFYNTNHPDGKAHGGTEILIKNRNKHHFHNTFATSYM